MGDQIDITWDPVKAASNAVKHGVTFEEAATVLLDPLALTVFDTNHGESEERWFTLGMSGGGRLLAVSHTHEDVEPSSARVRVISARVATRRERRQYEDKPA